jgi:FlaA1/EpsC-like NDP-sugar epimerase
LIYGAGRGGLLATRELLQNATHGLSPIGFIDDDSRKRRQRIDGLPVFGSLDDLAVILDRRGGTIGAVVVAIGDLPRPKLEQVLRRLLGAEHPRPPDAIQPGRSPPSKHPQEIVRFPGA